VRLIPSVYCFIFIISASAAERRPAGDELFSDPAIRHFKIDIADPELQKLRRDHKTYVRATVTAGEQTFKEVAVRLKGEGSFRPIDDRPSFAVKFDEFEPGQRYCGLNKIMLNNSSQDRSYLSEYLCTSLYRDADVPAPRATFARVTFNGRELGFYVLIEAQNKTFLKQHFANPNGVLYEGYARDIDKELEHDSGPPSDQSDVRALVAAARLPADQRLPELRKLIDIDRLISFLAVGMLIAQHDSYALNHNNYRLYRDPDSGRFTMIAHGIDGSFTQNTMPIDPPPRYILAKAIMETPETRRLYRERIGHLFTNVFKLDVMTNRLHAAGARLYQGAINEYERTNITARTIRFVDRVKERHQNVSQQLAASAAGP
jgi:spore coat protein H